MVIIILHTLIADLKSMNSTRQEQVLFFYLSECSERLRERRRERDGEVNEKICFVWERSISPISGFHSPIFQLEIRYMMFPPVFMNTTNYEHWYRQLEPPRASLIACTISPVSVISYLGGKNVRKYQRRHILTFTKDSSNPDKGKTRKFCEKSVQEIKYQIRTAY